MARPRRRPISPWFDINNKPPEETIVLGCSGIGTAYTIFEMILIDGQWYAPNRHTPRFPNAWMHRPTPPVWTQTKRKIEAIIGAPPGSIEGRKHSGKELLARKLFCWLAYIRHGHTICDIARAINRDHSTVIHHVEHVEKHIDNFASSIENIEREIKHIS